MEVNFGNMNERLVELFPELRAKYENIRDYWGPEEEPSPHVVYGDVLNPHIESLLLNEGNDRALERVFLFLEELASNSDIRVQEVVASTIIEYFEGKSDRTLYEITKRFMGKATLELAKEVELFWSTRKKEAQGGTV